jgi:U3 small nucleolar RNA-associated protein 5
VKVVGNTDFTIHTSASLTDNDVRPNAADLTIEEKLEAMELAEQNDESNSPDLSKKKKTKGKSATVTTQSLQTALVQALHSKDSALLEGCLRQRNPEVIAATVRRFPTAYVIPLLLQLIDKFQEKPVRAQEIMDWIRPVLQIHTAYLMTVPDLVKKLSNFYQAMDTRVSVLPKLLTLNGRLDIVTTQIDSRAHKLGSLNQHTVKDEKPRSVYVEQVSDDEAEPSDDEEDGDSMDVDGEDEDTTDLGYSDISDDDALEVSM